MASCEAVRRGTPAAREGTAGGTRRR
jgi:hypothetical protein